MSSKEYNREYHLKRYHKLKAEAIIKLGSKCCKCNSTSDLQIDHIDPKTKNFPISKLWGISKDKFWEEISKCQLLCHKCHIQKTFTNGDGGKFFVKCGTYSGYRYGCRCILCKEAEKKQRLNWK